MRTIDTATSRISRATPWLVPMLAALLLGCGSGNNNGHDLGGGADGASVVDAGSRGGADASIGAGVGHETYLLKMESVQGVSKNPPVPTPWPGWLSAYFLISNFGAPKLISSPCSTREARP